MALLIPVAFALGLPPETALILLAAVYLGCEYGGRISSILLNIPGEASTVMTTLDGYPMARKGLAGVALSLSAWSSFIGAFIATCGMVLFAPLLAKWAIAFGPAEYFVLMVSPSSARRHGRRQATEDAAGGVARLFLSCVGIDANSGVYASPGTASTSPTASSSWSWYWVCSRSARFSCCWKRPTTARKRCHRADDVQLREAASVFLVNLRCGVLGFVMGVLPGAGATLASAVAYMTEKKLAGAKGEFGGEGDMRGLAAPETAIGGAPAAPWCRC